MRFLEDGKEVEAPDPAWFYSGEWTRSRVPEGTLVVEDEVKSSAQKLSENENEKEVNRQGESLP
jgi:hypothetical protein